MSSEALMTLGIASRMILLGRMSISLRVIVGLDNKESSCVLQKKFDPSIQAFVNGGLM